MSSLDEDTKERNSSISTPLYALGINELKFSGTSFILRDLSEKYIYKVIKLHSPTEVLFYSIAYSIYIPYLENLKVNNINSSTFNNLSYLVENKLIPYFYGLTSISYLDYCWYEVSNVQNICNKIYKAIKLENLLRGFSNPGIIDIKMGSHNTEVDLLYRDVDEKLKLESVNSWRKIKKEYRNLSKDNQPVQYQFNLNASELGLPESFNNLDSNSLNMILKIWRQKQVAKETTEQELGFRISSIYIPHPNNTYLITSNESKSLDKLNAIKILKGIFNKDREMDKIKAELVKFLNCLKSWMSYQTSLSIFASSILIIFDPKNLNHFNIKWIDFSHIDNANSIDSLNAEGSNMINGINNLIAIIST